MNEKKELRNLVYWIIQLIFKKYLFYIYNINYYILLYIFMKKITYNRINIF